MILLFVLLFWVEYSNSMYNNWNGYEANATGNKGENSNNFYNEGYQTNYQFPSSFNPQEHGYTTSFGNYYNLPGSAVEGSGHHSQGIYEANATGNTGENSNNVYTQPEGYQTNYQFPVNSNTHGYVPNTNFEQTFDYNNVWGNEVDTLTQQLDHFNFGKSVPHGRQHVNPDETETARGQKHGEGSSSRRSKKKQRSQGEGSGNKGKEEIGQEGDQQNHIPHSLYPNEAKQFQIGIYLKRFDGGTVLLLESWEINNNVYAQYSTQDIENVLFNLGIAKVEYKENDDAVNKTESYGKIEFIQDSRMLAAEQGNIISTMDLAKRIDTWEIKTKNEQEFEWMTPGSNLDNPKFEPLFDGHVMVLLYDGIQEKYRIHWTVDRLNLFDTVNKISYFILEENGELKIIPEQNIWKRGDPIRGKRWKDNKFYEIRKTRNGVRRINKQLFTRPLTLYQLLNIAYKKVIRGRTSDQDHFKCRHFVYEFVMAITEEANKMNLLNHELWPENIRFIDEKNRSRDPTDFAFGQVWNDLKNVYNNIDYSVYNVPIPFVPPKH